MHNLIDSKVFGWLFLFTGIFSFISSLFAWGNGWLFSINSIEYILIPWADLIAIGPLSIVSAYGIFKMKKWRIKFGTLTSGAYIYSSVLVFIIILWHGKPYPIKLVIPSISGFLIGFSFFFLQIKKL